MHTAILKMCQRVTSKPVLMYHDVVHGYGTRTNAESLEGPGGEPWEAAVESV